MDLESLVIFLKELEANNNKPWFEAQTVRYKALRSGFTDMVQEIIYGLGAVDEDVQGVRADKALFRIHRDVRFAKDKSPYKSAFSAVIAPAGKDISAPLYYLQIDQSGEWLYAAGVHMPPLETATRIRQSIVAHAPQVKRILAASALQGAFPHGVQAEAYKRPPKGFDEDSPLLELIRLKSFAMSNALPIAPGFTSSQLADEAVAAFSAAWPWVQFLREALRVA